MNNPWKLIFVILFTCEEIIEAQSASNDSANYDLTNVLTNAILKLLKSTDLVKKLESQIFITGPKIQNFVYKINNTQKLPPFGSTIKIKRMFTFGSAFSDLLKYRDPPNTIRWELPKNTFHMFYDELKYWIVGHVLVEPDLYWTSHRSTSEFDVRYHKYMNFSIIATKPPVSANQSFNENIFINTSYAHLENLQGIKMAKYPKLLSYKQHLKLSYLISLELPSIMRRFFFVGGKFNALLGTIFNLHPKQYIISACPDFLTNEQRYYYLLPDINFVYISFKNITIRGLSNFESYVNNQSWSNRYESNDLVYTLHVKNVRGNMILEAGFEHLPHFQLSFFIGNLYISFVPKKGEFRVEARDYSIVEDTLQSSTLISSWLPEYSASIIRLIESAMIDVMKSSNKNKEKSSSLSSGIRTNRNFVCEIFKKISPSDKMIPIPNLVNYITGMNQSE